MYKTEDYSLVKSDKLVLQRYEIDTLSTQVQSLLPNDYSTLGEREQIVYKYLCRFKIQMAETFSILVEEVEIIIPEPEVEPEV